MDVYTKEPVWPIVRRWLATVAIIVVAVLLITATKEPLFLILPGLYLMWGAITHMQGRVKPWVVITWLIAVVLGVYVLFIERGL